MDDVAASDVPVVEESVVDPPLKKPRFDEGVNRVAEIVLVLSALRRIRGGKSPTELELELMVEAKSKLVDMCQEFSPKDIVSRDAIGAVIEDLGLNGKVKDQRLGFRAPKLTISEKLSLGKRKMEELKKHPIVSTSYTSPGHSIPTNNVSMAAHHQWPSSEMKASGSSVNVTGSHFVRDASGITQSRPLFKPDMHIGASQGPAVPTGSYFGNAATSWSGQPHSSPSTISFGTPSESKVHVQSSSRVSDPSFRPFMSQTPPSTFTGMKGVNYGQTSSPFGNNNHAEIAKVIHKVLQPRAKQNLLWNPPSREYMSKAITCQMCQGSVNEVETVLICDACEKGYHLKCLQANNLKSVPKSEWHCPRCVQLYNGKAFPPKYGRVMRSATTAKMSSSTGEVQASAEKKVGEADRKVANQESVSHSETAKATEDDTAMSQTVEAKDAAAINQTVEAEDATAISQTIEAEDAAAMNRAVDTNNESQDPIGNDAECPDPSQPVSHSETLNPPKVENSEDLNKDVTERSVSADCQDESSKMPPPSQSNTVNNADPSQIQNATPDVQDQEAVQKNVTEIPEEDKSC